MCGVSLVITGRVVKADYGWMFGVLTITNSLLSNTIVTMRCHNSSLKKLLPPIIIILFIPTYRPTFQLVPVRETKDLVEVA